MTNVVAIAPQPDDIAALAADYHAQLRADVSAGEKATTTVTNYMAGVDQFVSYLASLEVGRPSNVTEITRKHCRGFVDHLRSKGNAPDTLRSRWLSMKLFLAWLVDEKEIEDSPIDAKDRPRIPKTGKVPAKKVLNSDQLDSIFATCHVSRDATPAQTFVALRDEAILRLFFATGIRLDELSTLHYNPEVNYDPNETPFLDMKHNEVTVAGKGSKDSMGKRWRTVPFDRETETVLRRYLRARTKYLAAHQTVSDALWLSKREAAVFTYSGIRGMVYRAAERASVKLHPHMFRHTHASALKRDRKLSDEDIMRRMGWDNPAMLYRYGASDADERAKDHYRENYG